MFTKNSGDGRRRPRVAPRVARCVAGVALTLAVSLAEEEPFAPDVADDPPAESLRRILRKMSRVEDLAKAWLAEGGAAPGGASPLREVSRRQAEIAEDLARLVLKLQETQPMGQVIQVPGGDSARRGEAEDAEKRRQAPDTVDKRGEDPQAASDPSGESAGPDPARDVYDAAYRHRLLELLKAARGTARPWGNLPDKMRDEMADAFQEEFVPAYEALTRAYYKRVQEEAERRAGDEK